MFRHCMTPGIPHALIEVRQDLIADEAGVAAWAERLAPIFAGLNAMPDLHRYQSHLSRTGAYDEEDVRP
jgi:predicted N-formylglutamate amidohydrolase